MAASVEGTFLIIDRASGPMRAMERQARQTDRAIERLALTTDLVGSQKQTRQVQNLDRNYRTFGRTVDDTGSRTRRLTRDLENQDSRWQRLKTSVTSVGAALAGMGRIIGLLRLPAMGVAAGAAAQGIGTLAGGVIALLPRLTDLAGVVAALPATFTGMGLAMITVKLATHDLTQALHGNHQALKRLDPAARSFLQTLKSYHPIMQQLRTSAQHGLFAGLDRALPILTRGLPVANALLRTMSRTLGDLAVQASQRFTQPGFLQDILGIGRQGASIVGRGGTAILNMISGMRNLAVAAEPFTNWLTRMVVRFTQWFDRWSRFERDSGRFAAFLGRTRTSLTLFGHILGNILKFVGNLMRAARPLGDLLWRDVERGTKAWAAYSGSVRGQVRLTQDFLSMYPAIHAIVTLFDNLARTIFQMGTSQQLPGMVTTLGKLLPVLQKVLNTLVAAFGPQLANALVQVGDLLGTLVGAAGPLNIFLTLITNVLRVVNSLVSTVPGLGHVLATAFSVVAIGLFINRLRGVAAGWGLVADAANVAATAEARALTLGGGGFGGGGFAPIPAGRRGIDFLPGAALGRGAVAAESGFVGAAGRKYLSNEMPQWARTIEGRTFPMELPIGGFGLSTATGVELGAGGLLSRAGALGRGVLGRAGSVAGRYAWPVMAALGVYGGLTAQRSGSFGHQAFQTVEGGANSATGGLIGGITNLIAGPGAFQRAIATPDQLAQMNLQASQATMQQRLAGHGGASPSTYAQVAAQVKILTGYMILYRQQSNAAYKTAADGLRTQLQGLKDVKRQMDTMRAQQSRAGAARTLRQEGAAWDIYAGKLGPVEATRRTTHDVLREMAKLRDPGRIILAQQYSSWLREESQRNPALVGQYRTLRGQIAAEFSKLGTHIRFVHGQIVEGTAKSWRQMERAMTTPAERAREAVSKKFTEIQKKAVAVLEAIGIGSRDARKLVAEHATIKLLGQGMYEVRTPSGVGSGDYQTPAALRRANANDQRNLRRAQASALRTPGHSGRGAAHSGNLTGSGVKPYGGPTNNPLGGYASGLHPGIIRVADRVLERFPGLVPTSGLRPGDKGSYHAVGEAIDLAGSPGLMGAAASWIKLNLGGKLLEGIHNTGLSIKNGHQVPSSFWGATTWAQHANHIHLAAGNVSVGGGAPTADAAAGRTSGQSPQSTATHQAMPNLLMPRRAGLLGVAGTLADQVGMLFAPTSSRSRSAASAGRSSPGGGGTSVAGGMKPREIMALWMRAGGARRSAPLMAAIAMAESGGRPWALNTNSATHDYSAGLWQINYYGSLAPDRTKRYGPVGSLYGHSYEAAFKNAKAAVSLYDGGRGLGNWTGDAAYKAYQAKGLSGLTPFLGFNPTRWFRDGGSAVYRRPTVIGVGDNPRGERVTVTPLGSSTAGHQGGGGGVTLQVNVGRIEHRGEGDTRKIIYQEFEALARQLEQQPVIGDEDVTR